MKQQIAEMIIQDFINKPVIKSTNGEACYICEEDIIYLPAFMKTEEYYRTLFHEIVHSTGHPTRLNRDTLKLTNFINFFEDYKLVEEMTANYGEIILCGYADINPHSAQKMIHDWLSLRVIKQESIDKAVKYSNEAVMYIMGCYTK